MIKAYSYIRFSTKKQAFGDSLRRQTAEAQKWCNENGAVLDKDLTYSDFGRSAFDGSNVAHGELALFLDAVKQGRVAPGSILLVESLDRLSRANIPDAVALLTLLVRAGIEVVTLIDRRRWNSESIDNLPDFLMSVILFARANDESTTKSKRIREQYQARRDRCDKIICNIAPGWLEKDRNSREWSVVPDKAESVKKVFELYLSGAGFNAICTRANQENWPVPSFRPVNGWHISRVKRLIVNRAVLGEYEQQNGIVTSDFYPRIIDEQVFYRAQAINNSKKGIPRRRDGESLNVFQGLLACGSCGASLVLKNKGYKKNDINTPNLIYMCSDRVRGISKCPTWTDGFTLIETLVDVVYSLLADIDSTGEQLQMASALKREAEDAITEIQARYARILALAEATDNPPAGILRRLSEIESELKQARSKLDAVSGSANSLQAIKFDFDAFQLGIKAVLGSLGTSEGRERIRQRMVETVEIIFVYPAIKTIGLVTKVSGDTSIHWRAFGDDVSAYEGTIQLPPPRPNRR